MVKDRQKELQDKLACALRRQRMGMSVDILEIPAIKVELREAFGNEVAYEIEKEAIADAQIGGLL